MSALHIHRIAPGASVQDMGRTGYLGFGLSRGGAADRLALAEGAALLQQSPSMAVLELPGAGGIFEAQGALRIALTGAPMMARIDGTPVAWNASHLLAKGARLEIGAAEAGQYGYLHLGGGLDLPTHMGSRSAHLKAGVGRALSAGDTLQAGKDDGRETGLYLPPEGRFEGGTLRCVESLQTALFDERALARFLGTEFRRDPRASRMGAKLNGGGAGFSIAGGLNILSEITLPGDIQITGDGTPYLLLAESQTTGGYPRIATVIPADLPKAAQTPAGAPVRFSLIRRGAALEAERRMRDDITRLPERLRPLVRDPAQMRDLLSYQLISGVTAGDVRFDER
ncbi:biotin-dependent carboxyltransferase family protein [Marivita sp. GX14005]|uniref:5-oxoprolinase subunit C family protein n=1 Tax=Marivita sp. GX14005 TaxID=2942276 RepID=UPI0020198C21|nr:biotin-dependent carboxyltransferase family protein [Marivita sp. GX14005]MCL3882342.1 biotin-dependent carboxyltransferase family protein [Marivita sp. GX14005]